MQERKTKLIHNSTSQTKGNLKNKREIDVTKPTVEHGEGRWRTREPEAKQYGLTRASERPTTTTMWLDDGDESVSALETNSEGGRARVCATGKFDGGRQQMMDL
ncbi:hypothetical protein RJT34_22558 [Clitoria ternatea]|uniref:Uncharacterized protein n=1 Tax=Clitoria ternatea TaxID=43366 RepID=A0AAN9FR73_CLITE